MSVELWVKLSRIEPKFIVDHFRILYEEFRDKPFTVEDAEKVLKSRGVSIENVYKILSPLQKAGILKTFTDPKDFRKKFYQINLEGVGKVGLPRKDELFKLLDSAADLIRTAVDYNVILLFLFYKAISDKWDSLVAKHVSEGFKKEDAYLMANEELLKLYDEASNDVLSWSYVVRKPETIVAMDDALIRISRLNADKIGELETLVRRLGLTELSKGDKRSILVRLIELFNNYDFSGVDYDVLGDAYQWILAKFAPTKAKEGETYTPKEVIKLMVKLLDIENGSKVLDPACGSAAMLIEAYNYVKEKLQGENPTLKLYGQDYNDVMAAVAKMNLILHGITADTKIYLGDSLENPRFVKELELDKNRGADYVLANPPWNQDGYGEDRLSKPELRKIYKYGYPPNNAADWAWIQLMLWSTRRKVAIVLDQGSLFRGGREADIRRKIVDEDLVDAIILLPEKLFYNTGAPGIIIVFDKEKPGERKGKVLFINASNEYEPHPEVRRLNRLGDNNIEKIVSAYREFKTIEGFSRVVDLGEVRDNDYNLNVTLYVAPILETEEVDLEKELQELLEISKQVEGVRAKAIQYIQQVIQANKR